MIWKVYYSDGSAISSEDATPFSIEYGKRADVQVIIQESSDHKWVTLSGYDYYIWDDRGGGAKWFGVDIFGLHHYFLYPGSKCVLFGTMIDKNRFREIFNRAREDMMFLQPKEIYAKDERHPNETIAEAEFTIPEGTPIGSIVEYRFEANEQKEIVVRD